MDLYHYRNLPKHKHYLQTYKKFDYYWGLGLEHETYIKTSQKKDFQSFEDFLKPERYSVNYYGVYDPEALKKAFKIIFEKTNNLLCVPILINSHSLTHADIYGQHKTTYEKIPKPNPKYAGKTLFEWCCEHNKWLKENYEKKFIFDGDTIEFVTQNFYKTNIDAILNELIETEKQFVCEIKRLPKKGILETYVPLSLASPINEPFASYVTNLKNIAMFNNGTLHINLTLPTRLDWSCNPLFWKHFRQQHKRLARLIQWLEPFFVACYGSPDPFGYVSDDFARGSQRLVVSRYIGLGTYDTHMMPIGKILQIPRKCFPWYDRLYSKTKYVTMENIGLDINFNKHGAHGLELRFFDQMSNKSLKDVLQKLVVLMDVSLSYKGKIMNPIENLVWQSCAEDALLYGQGWRVSVEQQECINKIFKIYDRTPKEPVFVTEYFNNLFKDFEGKKGLCWKLMGSKT
jgi:hypothetical protein